MATPKIPSEVSEFYLACRNGDVKYVKEYLMKVSDTKWNLNNYEPIVQSTPLHAASFYGHKEIVQLLLEHGCDRSKVNSYGLTAYEEASSDEIRQLFKRPRDDSATNRFQDEASDGSFDFVQQPKENIEEVVTPTAESSSKTKKTPDVYKYKTKTEKQLAVGYSAASKTICQSRFGRFITDTFGPGAPTSLKSITDRLQEVIDNEITAKKNPQSQKANELLMQFLNDSDEESIKHLIRLYTLETNFYRALRQNPMPLALPLYIELQKLKDRYFQGQSYRGAKMNDDDIATYQWAINNRESLLQTRHFSSTSLKRSVAEEFATGFNHKGHNTSQNTVLFIFNFPEKCDQAINLSRISDELPSLSDFEDEAEVLLLPWTLFQVDSVKKESSSSSFIINLTNVVLPQKNMLSSFKWVLKHPKCALGRFHEYFPKKQPETVVKQLMNNFHLSDENISERKDQ